MTLNDPIADLLTRVRNGQAALLRYVDIRDSKMARALLEVLQKEGFILNFEDSPERFCVRVFLKYSKARRPVIQGLKRHSKPSVRKYVTHHNIPYVRKGMGISILSTSKGLMTGHEARTQGIGGEVLCLVW